MEKIEARLGTAGVESELLVMQSSGGVYRADSARERPVYMVESGPAAGVIAATFMGGLLGHADVLSFDMGGDDSEGRPRPGRTAARDQGLRGRRHRARDAR